MTDSTQQTAQGTAIAQALGAGATATVNVIGVIGADLESLVQAAVRGATADLRVQIDELATQLHTSREAVLGFLTILGEDQGPVEALADKLILIAQRYLGMLDRLSALDPEDARAQGYINEAQVVLQHAASASDYDRADALLSLADGSQGETLRKAEALEREAREAVNRIRTRQADTRLERGELSLTRLDYRGASDHFQSAASVVDGIDTGFWVTLMNRSVDALFSQGEQKGDNRALMQAIELCRIMLTRCTRESHPPEWAMVQNNLGGVFGVLGERESGTDRLKDSIAAYREALTVRTRERMPIQWAMTQQNLGTTLACLGFREGGTSRLREAVEAYREALKVRTRGNAPGDWAMTQNNLGNALRRLGERETETSRLEEAVEAYRQALEVRTREKMPLNWAMTQDNLGVALRVLGEREKGTKRLLESVAAHTEALQERTRDRVPLQWADSHLNLGAALGSLGEREPGAEWLKAAIQNFREALKELRRERAPLGWAAVQHNLGKALLLVGDRESVSDRERAKQPLVESITAFREALQERREDLHPLDWADTQLYLGKALVRLGDLALDLELIFAARDAVKAAWTAYRRAGMRQFDQGFAMQLTSIDTVVFRLRAGVAIRSDVAL
jgi:tetratricopeptide (TPR) repeat protein